MYFGDRKAMAWQFNQAMEVCGIRHIHLPIVSIILNNSLYHCLKSRL